MTRLLASRNEALSEQNRASSSDQLLRELKAHARLEGKLFEDVLLRFVEEALVCAISTSPCRGRFPLHGAWALAAWMGGLHRPTRGIDVVDLDCAPARNVQIALQGILGSHQGDLRLAWDNLKLRTRSERRSELHSFLLPVWVGSAMVHIAIHVMAARDPTLGTDLWPLRRTFPNPDHAWVECCRAEVIVAEKAALMVTYGPDYSRFKDVLDLWLISRRFAFDGASLLRAVRRIFSGRDAARMILRNDGYWEAAFSNARLADLPFPDGRRHLSVDVLPSDGFVTVGMVDQFLRPILDAMRDGRDLASSWCPSSGWTADKVQDAWTSRAIGQVAQVVGPEVGDKLGSPR